VYGVGIDPDSLDWPYQQVAARIRERIRAGALGPRLPSYMSLAHELEVSPMTVQRAIKVLRDEGLVVTRPGRGTFVVPEDQRPGPPA
jgi:GntR family transcriptional regulator